MSVSNPPTKTIERQSTSGGATPPMISVVVITFNRADSLLIALRSAAAAVTDGRFDFELVVVDNNSTDHTQQAVSQYARECPIPVRVARESRPGIPFARNCGIRAARGEWICFFDDDQTAQPDWLLRLYETAIDHSALCVGGARNLVVEPGQQPPATARGRMLLGECPTTRPAGAYHRQWLPNTGNVLLHRSVFKRVGEFDESALEGGDDTDFFNRLVKSGLRARFTPLALVHHHIPTGRLTENYLCWVAKRHGVIIARRDLCDGRAYFLFSLLGRLVQAAVVFAPQYAIGRAFGRREVAFDAKLRLSRTGGFVSLARHLLTPRMLRGERVFSDSHHRESGAVAAAKAGSKADPRTEAAV